MSTQTETETGGENIDYEALAKAAYFPTDRFKAYDPDHVWAMISRVHPEYAEFARVIVAAYRQQMRERGIVEVRAEDIERAREYLEDCLNSDTWNVPEVEAFIVHLAALVAAPTEDSDGR